MIFSVKHNLTEVAGSHLLVRALARGLFDVLARITSV